MILDRTFHSLYLLAYFSLVTITTTGFGDIYPDSEAAMMWVSGEILFGSFYGVLFLSVLGGLVVRGAGHHSSTGRS
jgi:hypothetical protein